MLTNKIISKVHIFQIPQNFKYSKTSLVPVSYSNGSAHSAQESTEPYILMVMYTMVMHTAGRNQCNYKIGMHRYERHGVKAHRHHVH